jgi:excinuclease UvrABC nuclease subunit
MRQYGQIVQEACRFAAGDHQAVRAKMQQEMRDLAGRQLYEQAAALKARLDRLAELEKPDFAYVSPLARFGFLLFHHGSSFHQAKTFLVDRGHLQPGPALEYPPAAAQAAGLLEAMAALVGQHQELGQEQWEAAGLVNHYLFSSPEKRGLALRYCPALTAEEVCQAVVAHAELLGLRAAKHRRNP